MTRLSLTLLFTLILIALRAQMNEPHLSECKCAYSRAYFKAAQMTENATYADYDLIYHNIFWEVDPAHRFISGKISSTFIAKKASLQSIQFDLHDTLLVDSVKSALGLLSFSHKLNILEIQLGKSLSANEQSEVTVYYHGVPPFSGSGAFETILRHGSTPEMWTLSEPYGAMEWWPCKQSLVDKIDSIDVSVTVPVGFYPASNGLPVEEKVQDNKLTVHYKHRYPIAAYLIAFAVSNYEQFSEPYYFANGDSMLLINFMFPEYLARAKLEAVNTPKVMDLYNELFMPYPFRKEWYGHTQFSRGGGMEHQTMSFMGDLEFQLLAHEMAHQWFGDYATLNSWHDIWLNEGFATYLSGLAFEHLNNAWWYRWREVVSERVLSEPDGSVYVEDTTDVDRIFSGRLTYYKGAYLLHMLRWELGNELFYKSIQNYLADEEVAYGFSSFDRLVYHFETTADTSLTEFFKGWYYGEGYPIYQTFWQQEGDTLYIEVEQRTSHPSVLFYKMHVPIRVVTTNNDTLNFRLKNDYNNQKYALPMFSDTVKEVLFDPEIWLLSKHSVVLDSSIPNYKKEVRIYPNPTSDKLHIINSNNKALQYVVLYNIQGQILHEQFVNDAQVVISTARFGSGQYLLRIGKGKYTRKIVVIP